MATVFISYSRKDPDQQLARQIADHLRRSRISYFFDQEISPGLDWVEEISREIERCKILVALVSINSIQSDMVRKEIAIAYQNKKRIVPIRIRYSAALPLDFGAYLDRIQCISWDSERPFSEVLASLLATVTSDTGPENTEGEDQNPTTQSLQELAQMTEQQGIPLPAADPRLETGAINLDSPFYITRAADSDVETFVIKGGQTILLKGPRQVGKTSLSARAKYLAESRRQRTSYIDFQLVDDDILATLGTLVTYLAAQLYRDLRLRIQPGDEWSNSLGHKTNLTNYIERAILAEDESPVLICLDEVDQLFKKPYRDDFFGMVRAWHNRRATSASWCRFSILIVHSTEPSLFIRDLNQSPFNIGSTVLLGDFTFDQIQSLNQKHGSPIRSAEDLESLIALVGGHPYLIRQALYALVSRSLSLEELIRSAPREDGIFDDHLRRNLWFLRQDPALRKALLSIIHGGGCEGEEDFQRLRSGGLISGDTRNTAHPRCELYAIYMKEHL